MVRLMRGPKGEGRQPVDGAKRGYLTRRLAEFDDRLLAALGCDQPSSVAEPEPGYAEPSRVVARLNSVDNRVFSRFDRLSTPKQAMVYLGIFCLTGLVVGFGIGRPVEAFVTTMILAVYPIAMLLRESKTNKNANDGTSDDNQSGE